MRFDQKELAIIGHWSSTSKMPERYDRSVCSRDLLLRNKIAHKFATGWEPAPAYHLPTTVVGNVRIGKPDDEIDLNATDSLTRDTPVAAEPVPTLDTEVIPDLVDETRVGKLQDTTLVDAPTELTLESSKPEDPEK